MQIIPGQKHVKQVVLHDPFRHWNTHSDIPTTHHWSTSHSGSHSSDLICGFKTAAYPSPVAGVMSHRMAAVERRAAYRSFDDR